MVVGLSVTGLWWWDTWDFVEDVIKSHDLLCLAIDFNFNDFNMYSYVYIM